jgi:hypothetical protein
MLWQHPQTGEQLNQYDCAINWANILQIEAAQQMRQTGASVDKLRADSMNTSVAIVRGLMTAAQNLRPTFRLPWRRER